MRFKADGPAIPDVLLDERDAGNVVFLCGAGVSIPAGMPNFLDLARHVTGEVDPPSDSEIRRALQTFDETGPPVAEWCRPSLDQVFQMLYQEYGRDQVVKIVWKKLNEPPETQRHHGTIARLSANAEGHPQIVTTNFDRLFEAALGKRAPRYEPPMYPDLRHGVPATGVTYLHGRRAATVSGPHNYILSSGELGRAYLAEGWATKFVRDLLREHTVVLLGYRADDPPVRYLLEGLDTVGQRARKRLFAFAKGEGQDVDAKWRACGIQVIRYGGKDHEALWETLEAWADRADNPTSWRSNVARLSGKGPRALAPHERGMVAHLVKTAVGAKEFAERKPGPPAEWLCVFDVACRYAEPAISFGEDPAFDPLETYRLDGDPPRPRAREQHNSSPGDDLISWRRGDESVGRWRRLSRRWGPQHEPLPPRLSHLAGWLASRVTDPVLAWWVARQPTLDPYLHRMLKRAVDDSPDLIDGAERGWMVLLEALECVTPQTALVNLNRLHSQIRKHGWTPGLIREFEALTEPVFAVGPPNTLAEPQPPSGDWSNVEWKTVADLRIRFPSRGLSRPPVPDADLPSVYPALERNIMRASERLREIGWRGSALQTFYPRDGDDADDLGRSDQDAYVRWFRRLLDRLSTFDADRLRKHVALWPDPDPRIFDKLRIYVWSKSRLFSGTEAVENILALSDVQFWRDNDRRELLFLLRGRWDDLPANRRRLIGRRVLNGPPRRDEEGGAAQGGHRQTTAATCFGWLVQAGCAFPDDLVAQWQTLKGSLPGWDDGWVDRAVAARVVQVRDVETNEDTSVLEGVPVGDIVRVSLDHSGRTGDPFVENEPFTGLVKTRPVRAVRALVIAARGGEYPAHLWSSAIRHWPENAPRRATTVLHGLMRRLPPATIVGIRGTVGDWLAGRFPDVATDDRVLAHGVFDHLVEALSTTGSEGPASPRGEWTIGASVVQASRPTLSRGINAPIGKAVVGLLEVLRRDNPEQGAGLPEDFKVRVDRLLSASGEGADDAVCVLSSRVGWLKRIDPGWVDAKMIPWFRLDHDRAESAWNGILWDRAGIWLLFDEIKDGFLHLPTRMDEVCGEEMELYCKCIVALAVASGADERRLSFEDARQCLRRITPEGHEHVIWLLGPVGKNDDGWRELVIPFIRGAWPNESEYRTSGTSRMWLSLLCDTGDAFPDVLDAVGDHLGEVDWRHAMLDEAMESLAQRYPRQTLGLLDRVVPDGDGQEAPYELSRVLDLLVEAKPRLNGDPRHRRLHRLAARQ